MNPGKLNLYTEKEILPSINSHTFLLLPFYGNYFSDNLDPDYGRFDEYVNNAESIFNITQIPEKADYFLLPFGYTDNSSDNLIMNAFIEKGKSFGKKTIIFFNSDEDFPIHLNDVIIFRTSFNKSNGQSSTYALPGWSKDFLNYFPNKKFDTLKPETKPTVSYCGYIDFENLNWLMNIRLFLSRNSPDIETKSKARRGKACRKLRSNDNIICNFIIRNGFWAQGINDKLSARTEYAHNIIDSLYGLAIRGAGNFSYRLFEILSAGRIPLFVNTDCALPYESLIDWKKHVVWVEENEISKIDKILIDFHKSKSFEELNEIQRNNRKLYEQFLSPLGFYSQLGGFLKLQNEH